jgi:hypothetical protein
MVKMFSNFLALKISVAIEKNKFDLISSVARRDPKLIERIENFRNEKMSLSEREETSTDDILQSIRTDSVYQAIFRKDPVRQSIHEKTQIEWIQRVYPDAYKLNPNIGGKCLWNNTLYHISSGRPTDATKSFDIFTPSRNAYGVLKYTSVPGGAQDNQYADVKHFITQAIGGYTGPEIFEFYLDGPYYTESKIDELKSMIPDDKKNCIVITSCELLHQVQD